RMQNRGIAARCPALPTVNLHGQSASATFLGCAPTVDSRSSPQFARYPTSASFNANSTHAVVPSPGGDEYLVGDQGGNFYRFGFGSTAPNWTVAMGGSVTGAPLAMPDGLTVFVPVANPTASGGCVGGSDCVALLSGGESSPECYMAAADVVSARPAAGRNFPT